MDSAKDWFPKDTWLLVALPTELSPANFSKCVTHKVITLKGQLQLSISNQESFVHVQTLAMSKKTSYEC